MTEQKKPETKTKKIMKRITTGFAILLALAIIGLIFVYVSPSFGLYFVKSGSMRPVINPGDIVITGPVGEVRTGNIITFEQGEAIVTHRVIAIENGKLRTKGDANEDPDTDPLTLNRVQGKYLLKIPFIGYINSFVSNRQGWFVVIIIPTVVLVLFIAKDILKETFKKEEKKETKGGDAISGNEK
ncbi:MAG: signal peptidase I [Dehalococcoidia bacterium]|nr:signal peptidase I [Dehalococcoidia bacterium]